MLSGHRHSQQAKLNPPFYELPSAMESSQDEPRPVGSPIRRQVPLDVLDKIKDRPNARYYGST